MIFYVNHTNLFSHQSKTNKINNEAVSDKVEFPTSNDESVNISDKSSTSKKS